MSRKVKSIKVNNDSIEINYDNGDFLIASVAMEIIAQNLESLVNTENFDINSLENLHLIDQNKGDLFTIKKFKEMIDDNSIMFDDGHGYFATNTHYNQHLEVFEHGFDEVPKHYTHILWFNK